MEQGFPQWSEAPQQVIDASKSYTATFVTTAGNMVFELDPGIAPTTVNSFVCLASSGYYDFTLFIASCRVHDPGRRPYWHWHWRPGLPVQ
jgi:hypothetical protein